MPTKPVPIEKLQEAINLVEIHGSSCYAAAASGIPETTLRSRFKAAQLKGLRPTQFKEKRSPRIHEKLGRTHMVIPDVQAKHGVPDDHLEWIANYALDKRPDVIVQIGDWADMPSLSTYDKGTLDAEGRRYIKDITALNHSLGRFEDVIEQHNREHPKDQYKPRKVITLGNHEERIIREIQRSPIWAGAFSFDDFDFKKRGWECHEFLEKVTIDGIQYCLDPDHKVLTADLRYIRIRDLNIGDRLIGFDEQPPQSHCGRRYKTAIVEKLDMDFDNLYEVALSNGKVFRTNGNHQWLVRTLSTTGYIWKTTLELSIAPGQWRVSRLFPEWEESQSRDAGWLAGIFDGEGWLSKPNSKQGGVQLGVAQNEGLVLDKVKGVLDFLGIKFAIEDIGKCKKIQIQGPSSDKLELLGKLRPIRLIQKFKPEMLGRLQKPDGYAECSIQSVTPIGRGQIAKIQTSTRTMIVEGYPHHNSHYFISGRKGLAVSSARALLSVAMGSATMGHTQDADIAVHKQTQHRALFCGVCYTHDEKYLGRQGNDYRRQIVMKHEVKDGLYDLCEVSLRFLKKRYS